MLICIRRRGNEVFVQNFDLKFHWKETAWKMQREIKV
jgi:hypothetical protein